MRYGMPPQNSQNSPWLARDLRGKPEKHFKAYVSLFMRHLCEPGADNSETFADGVPREGISRQHVLTRIGTMALIRKKVREYEDKNGEFSMPLDDLNGEEELINNSNNFELVKANSTNNNNDKELEQENSKKVEGSSGNDVKVKNEKVETEETDEKMEVDENKKQEETKDETKGETKDETKEDAKETTQVEENGKDENEESSSNKDENNKTSEEGEKVVEEAEKAVEENKESKEDEKNDRKEDKTEIDDKQADSANEKTNDKPVKQEKVDEENESIKKESSDTESSNKENTESSPKKSTKPKFMFNIADGGFTELHSIWQTEEKAAQKNEYEVWHRKHDYWLLAGIVKHGYARWQDLQTDPVFNLINEPFKMDINKGNFLDIKNKFIARRFKLLEQALAIEEQLRRAKQLNLTQDQSNPVLSLNTRFNELECVAEANQHLVKEQQSGNKQATVVLKNVLNQLDDMLNEMRNDATRLPQTLARVQSVSQRLLLSERTILSRLAGQAQMQQAQMIQRQQQLLAQQALQQQLQAQLLLNLTPEQIQLLQQGLFK